MRYSWIAMSALMGLALLAPAANAQQRIAVVHISDVVSNMAEAKAASKNGLGHKNDAEIERGRREQEIQKMQGDLNQLKGGSPQWNDVRNQLEDKQMMYQVWLKKTQVTLDRAAKDDLKKLFDHVNEATQQIAMEQHFNLVLADAPEEVGPNNDQLTFQQYGALLSQRVVMFADKTVDITQDVLTRVDALYAKQQGATAPAPMSTPVIPVKK